MGPSLITLNENLLTALDVETTGRDPNYHEIIQIALVPLDVNLNPIGTPFYTNICPRFPNRMSPEAVETHGLTIKMLAMYPDTYTVQDQLWDWFQNLNLVPKKRLIPLAHNSQFDIAFLQSWLGVDHFYEIFGYPTRDTQAMIAAMQDRAAFKNLPIRFDRASLGRACEILGITLDDAHDALADAVATAKVYKALINLNEW